MVILMSLHEIFCTLASITPFMDTFTKNFSTLCSTLFFKCIRCGCGSYYVVHIALIWGFEALDASHSLIHEVQVYMLHVQYNAV